MAFQFPPIHDFKPMYTRQPNAETWARQLQLWGEMVLAYCRHHRIYNLDLQEALAGPLFRNDKIGRALNRDIAIEVLNHLAKQGNAEWDRNWRDRNRCTIVWRTPEQWADIIYRTISEHGANNTVLTVYELLSGDEYADASFHELEKDMFWKAIAVLERAGKARRIQSADQSEEGVKFF